jgi:hypothetical protein
MGVILRGFAVSCPSGVGNANGTLYGYTIEFSFQLSYFPYSPVTMDGTSMLYGNAGGVVTPIFKLFQPFQEDWSGLLLSHVTHNTAHLCLLDHSRLFVDCCLLTKKVDAVQKRWLEVDNNCDANTSERHLKLLLLRARRIGILTDIEHQKPLKI